MFCLYLFQLLNNPHLDGKAVMVREDSHINFGRTLYSPHADIPYDWYSVRWTGALSSPVTGKINIGIERNNGYRLYINDEFIIDNRIKKSNGRITGE